MFTSRGAAVVGAGPNGLAAAVTLARAGIPVTVFEAAESIGGGARTSQILQRGVFHDVCSAIHPLALASTFFRRFEIERRVQFIVPGASYAHPLDGAAGDRAAIAYRDLERTVAELGVDGPTYGRFYRPVLNRLEGVLDFSLGGSVLRMPSDVPAAIVAGARIAEQGSKLWNARFTEQAAPSLISGVAAHSIGPLPALATAGVGLVLGALGHATGWPVPIGGSGAIIAALAADLETHGGRILTDHPIEDFRQLAEYEVKIFDTSARGLAQIVGDEFPMRYRRILERFTYGDAASKVDFILDGPIPWRDPRVLESATVHVGGSRTEIARAERDVARGVHPEHPYVLVAQTAHFDTGRNPASIHAVSSYTHVPRDSRRDVSEAVVAQIERFAPGFRDCIREIRSVSAQGLGQYNRNYHGGDFSAGAVSLRQLLARPTLSSEPWRTPLRGVYLASSSTPPGPGVHGLSGWYAAESALRREYGVALPHLGADGGATEG